jgi:dimethylaniline monooxygenase (N-oxide forming)
MNQVAVIGAGPAGIAAARWLRREGFEPLLLEQGSSLGGQWSGDPGCSGIWPSMHTNTCREMTQFSDLAHPPETPLYPSNQAMRAYLVRYAEQFGLLPRLRLNTRVVELARSEAGTAKPWALRWFDEAGTEHRGAFSHVVVASGRFGRPRWVDVPGLETFDGACGASHTFAYKDPGRYVGRSVLVAGCAVSALEIAADLAMLGAARVVTTSRRQRYIVQKLAAGVPIEHLMQTRHAADMQRRSPQAAAIELKRLIVATSGAPQAFGAMEPDADLTRAGVAQCQSFLPLVAEGRIRTKPWIATVQGRRVTFVDGTSEDFDGLIFGTGFDVDLPFLSPELRRELESDGQAPALYKHTFHPEHPSLALCGQFQLSGPYLPPIELQARWIAYAWAGARPLPTSAVMRAAADKAARCAVDKLHMPSLMMEFAGEAGVVPDLRRWSELHDALLHGPLTPMSFRLQGRDSLLEAAARVRETARTSQAVRGRLGLGRCGAAETGIT